MHGRLTSQLLGYAGLLPFYGFILGFALLEDFPQSLSVQGFVIYSLAILSFLGGTLWGRVQSQQPRDAIPRLIVSNGIVLFAVASILTAQAMLAAILLMLGYLATLWYERRVEPIGDWYANLRWRLTLGVVLAHLIYAGLHIAQA